MPDFLTRHCVKFVLTEGQVDPNLSPYKGHFPNYPQKCSALAAVVGKDQFLWAVEHARGFSSYEMCKPVEWKVRVPDERVLGYVDDDCWMAFLEGKSSNLWSCYSTIRPHSGQFSVLLPFPLKPSKLVRKRVFDIQSPNKARVAEEVVF